MSKRKKRMILFVVGVCLCGILFFLVGNQVLNKDKEEFLRQCREYEGIWNDEKGEFSLEIYRVTSGHMAFSLHHKKFKCDVSFMTAYSVGDGYEFTYNAVRLAGTTYRIHAGESGTGRIHPDDNTQLQLCHCFYHWMHMPSLSSEYTAQSALLIR